MSIVFKGDKEIKKVASLLQNVPNAMPKAVSRAANRAIQSARTQGVKTARSEYLIKAGDVKATLSISKASTSFLSASIRSSGRPISLKKFKTSKNRKGIRAKVKKTGGKTIPKAFFTTMKNSHQGVFIRKGKERYPIENLHGPSAPQTLGNEKVTQAMEKRAQEQFETRLIHETGRLLKGMSK